ncbi:hypothetical protein ACTFIW_001319 [Dictyostelium discoideum]
MVMIDDTNRFLECVKRKCNDPSMKNKISNQTLLKKNQTKKEQQTDIIIKASISIYNTINTLELFLNEHKEAYINTTTHIKSMSSKMTDEEREEIDKLSTNQIEVCKSSIKSIEELIRKHYTDLSKSYKKELSKWYGNKSISSSSIAILDIIRDDPADFLNLSETGRLSLRESLENYGPRVVLYSNIVDQLKHYLNNVSNSFKKLRSFRLNLKLKESEKLGNKATQDNTTLLRLRNKPSSSLSSTKDPNSYNYEEEENEKKVSTKDLYGGGDDDDDEFDEEEMQIYEQQNSELKAELETLADQIEVINRQVEELSQLFDEITPHILQHKEVITNIHTTTIEATNYVTRGNNQIYEATKKSFDFRVMVLLFLIISSLSLLFLNWYQD